MLQQEYIPLVNHSHKQANLDDTGLQSSEAQTLEL